MKTVRCPQCNLVCWNTVPFCSRCNFDIQSIVEQQESGEAENNSSFERNENQHSVQNSASYAKQNPPDTANGYSDNQQDYQSNNQNKFNENQRGKQNYGRNPYSANNRNNYQDRNQFGKNSDKTKKGLAIFSLVSGIIGFPPIGFIIGGILAAILGTILGTPGLIIGLAVTILIPVSALISGIVAVRRSGKNPREFGGKGLAIAGICCSGFVLLFSPITAAIAIPNLLAARRAANEGSAISSMRQIAEAESTYRTTTGKACADLTVLGSSQLVDTVLAKGNKSGFRFVVTKLPTPENDCAITATPESNSTGNRAFYFSTEDGEFRARTFGGQMATKDDEPLSRR